VKVRGGGGVGSVGKGGESRKRGIRSKDFLVSFLASLDVVHSVIGLAESHRTRKNYALTSGLH